MLIPSLLIIMWFVGLVVGVVWACAVLSAPPEDFE
jgi:hypothetical protein